MESTPYTKLGELITKKINYRNEYAHKNKGNAPNLKYYDDEIRTLEEVEIEMFKLINLQHIAIQKATHVAINVGREIENIYHQTGRLLSAHQIV